jgi:hypothetical protein
MDSISNFFHSTVEKVTGKTAQQHADDMKAALKLPSAAVNDAASSKALGASPEPVGTTMTGGRRRTRRGKKARKTRRRRGGAGCPLKCPKSEDGKHKFGRSVNLGDVSEKQCQLCKCVEST